MYNIISGVCLPLFIYLTISLSGLLAVLFKGDENSGLVSFLIFMILCLSTLFINVFCYHDWYIMSWVSSIFTTSITLFVINAPYLGNIDIISYIGSFITKIVSKFKKIKDAINFITSKN